MRFLSRTFQSRLINGFREPFNNIYTGVDVYEAPDGGNAFVFKDFNKAGDWMWIRFNERQPKIFYHGVVLIQQRKRARYVLSKCRPKSINY